MSYIAHFWYFGFLWAACWALISVFGSPWSSAQTQQYAFQAPWDASLLFGTGDAVCTARQPDIEATYGPAGFTGITHTSTGDATPTSASSGGACQYQGTRFGATGQITQFSFGAVACGASGQAVCPVQHCTPTPGVTNTFSGTSVTMATSSYCNGVDDCQVNVTQSVGVDGQLIYTGVESSSDCSSGQPPVPAGSSSPAAPQCATGASGMTYCTNPTGGGNCGEINNQFVCLGNIPQGGCVAMAAGDKACDSSAGTPPAPDSGTAGHPATPTDTINTSGGGGCRLR